MTRAPSVHPTADVDPSARISQEAEVGPFARVAPGCSIGKGTTLAAHVILEGPVEIGNGCVLSSGVFVRGGTCFGDDVVVGPNAAFVDPSFRRSPGDGDPASTLVADGASIGANATVLAGVSIGSRAVVGANAVVTRDVPPHATVVGSPARIVGYSSSPRFATSRRIHASALADDQFPVSIGRAALHQMPAVEDLRGVLTFGEAPTHLPFVPQRYFLVFGVSSREVRGEHAHRGLHQLLICAHGECAIAVDDGTERGEVMLDRRDVALHSPPMVWMTQYRFSADAVLLVLASARYDADDYIRDYDEFCELVGRP